jgi:hypothetical protein
MRYMLLMYRDDTAWEALPVQERGAIYRRAVDYSEDLKAAGRYQGGDPLQSSTGAVTVRMKDGRAVTTDGPFAETKEQLGGYSIVDVKDVDEALAIVADHPLLYAGFSIEVREIRGGPPR